MLRDYQTEAVAQVYAAWAEGAANVMLTAPTGSGKTVVMGHIARDLSVPTVAIAHRMELIAQIALAFNREAVPHSVIAPSATVRHIVAAEMSAHGFSNYDARSSIKIASVHTLAKRDRTIDPWFDRVQLVVIDEGHHVTRGGIWNQALAMFPNARGLFVTAHAIRGDGQGLGRHADGLVDRLVVGPSCRSLIDRGMLTDYRIACPSSDVNLASVHVGASGEFNQKEVRAAVHASSTITGDVVGSYLKFAPGKLGISFAVDLDSAGELAAEYRRNGVPAEIITGETDLSVRAGLMQQFRERRILQLVSVDVLGEGVDVPAVEVISMARPTNSFQLFAQQTGRALRLNVGAEYVPHWNNYTDDERKRIIAASSKPRALIIDHVQNTLRHGLPDVPREYSLNRREKAARGKSDAPMLRACLECLQPFPRYLTACEHCGHPVVPGGRASPEAVEGDMVLLDDAILAAMRREIARVDGPVKFPDGAPRGTVVQNHMERQRVQITLRAAMALFGSLMSHEGHDIRVGQKIFWREFGTDILTAQTLGATDAEALRARVQTYLDKRGVVPLESAA